MLTHGCGYPPNLGPKVELADARLLQEDGHLLVKKVGLYNGPL